MAKRRILLVDDEVAVLLTMKTVLELNGFQVDTAASAREARSRIKLNEYQMVITDMRMESDAAGRDVILAARSAPYHPAVALLTSFPDDDWADIGADKMLVKPMQTAVLLRQIEEMLALHAAKLQRLAKSAAAPPTRPTAARKSSASSAASAGRSTARRFAAKKLPGRAALNRKRTARKQRKG
ncbi:MAG: response regulator [Acidobacteriaceae bacterium]